MDKTAAAAAKLEEYNQAVAQQEHLNTELAAVEQAKKDAIASSQLPVPGLTFDDTQLYLNGLPFEPNQINTARSKATVSTRPRCWWAVATNACPPSS